MYTLFIGIPTYGKPDSQFAIDSLSSLLYHIGRRHPEIEDVWVQRDVRTYRQEARQAIVKGAQEVGATHLMMLDDDHIFGPEQFDTLWNTMHTAPEKPQVISGLYFTRGQGTAPCIFKLTNEGTAPYYYYPRNRLMEVDVVGFGFIIFDMKVFDLVNPPWFNLAMGFGEDAAFCARLMQAGIPCYVHTGCRVGHILETPTVITEEVYLAQRAKMEQSIDPGRAMEAGESEAGGGEEPELKGERRRTGYAVDTRPWWRPPTSRVWKRDSDIGTLEVKHAAVGPSQECCVSGDCQGEGESEEAQGSL